MSFTESTYRYIHIIDNPSLLLRHEPDKNRNVSQLLINFGHDFNDYLISLTFLFHFKGVVANLYLPSHFLLELPLLII